MILKKIQLEPFAGMAKVNLPFKRGINVLLGPNEAGKSTLVNALRMVLFMPTNYNKRTFESEIQRFMPLTGGDTVRVRLDFEEKECLYHLSRSWGAQRYSELKATGILMTDPDAIQDMLDKMLGFGLHTFDTVICATQSGLGATMDELAEYTETIDQLAAIMRHLVLVTDGVSIEHLGDLLEQKHAEYFDHWDRTMQCPEKNRGIDDPWKQRVGIILNSYYRRESAKKKLEETMNYYQQLAVADKEDASLEQEIADLQKWVAPNELLVKNMREIMVLTETQKRLSSEKRHLESKVKEWLKLESDAKTEKAKLQQIEGRVTNLQGELRQAQQAKTVQEKSKKFEAARIKKGELDGAKTKSNGVEKITEEIYRGLTQSYDRVSKLKAILEGGKLSLTMIARKPIDICVTKDLEPKEIIHLESAPLQVSAGGKITIDHAEWNMEVGSGTIDFNKIQQEFFEASSSHQNALQKLGMKDLAEAKDAHDRYQTQLNNIAVLNAQLDQILGGDSYIELEKTIAKSSGQIISTRPLETISIELGSASTEARLIKETIDAMDKSLAKMVQEYHSYDKLLELYACKMGELKDVNTKVSGIPPIPQNIEDPKKFIEEWESQKEKLENKQDEWNKRQIVKAKTEALAPEESESDLRTELTDAESDLEHVKQEGEAIAKVRDVFDRIRQDADKEPLAPWLKGLGETLEPMTLNRFNAIALSDNVPKSVMRADGVDVPMENLSAGTKVGLGLALRLSMAEYFTQEGVVVLDDPLVDLDPERQLAAANILKNFAKNRQIIVVTCHPDHAKLIGGDLLSLEGPSKPGAKPRHKKGEARKQKVRPKVRPK